MINFSSLFTLSFVQHYIHARCGSDTEHFLHVLYHAQKSVSNLQFVAYSEQITMGNKTRPLQARQTIFCHKREGERITEEGRARAAETLLGLMQESDPESCASSQSAHGEHKQADYSRPSTHKTNPSPSAPGTGFSREEDPERSEYDDLRGCGSLRVGRCGEWALTPQ